MSVFFWNNDYAQITQNMLELMSVRCRAFDAIGHSPVAVQALFKLLNVWLEIVVLWYFFIK